MNVINFSRTVTTKSAVLQQLDCPACGNGCLHHGEVVVYDRVEDDPVTLVTRVGMGTKTEITNGKGNPSSRRHGLTIEFSCEHCSANPVLELQQHKGSTYLSWRF